MEGMEYELAKQLKDAGFPQKTYLGARFYSDVSHPRMGRYPGDVVIVQITSDNTVPLGTYIPTLEELIEACEEVNFILGRDHKGYDAQVYSKFGRTYTSNYPTPTEAVARLWLALNKPVVKL